jgi:hypothetical protein
MHRHSYFSSSSTINFLLVGSLVFCLLLPGGVQAREDRSSDSSDLNSFSKNSEGGSSSGGDPGDGIIGDPGDGLDKCQNGQISWILTCNEGLLLVVKQSPERNPGNGSLAAPMNWFYWKD